MDDYKNFSYWESWEPVYSNAFIFTVAEAVNEEEIRRQTVPSSTPANGPLLPAMGLWLSPKACPALPCHGISPTGKALRWGCTSLEVICSSRAPLLARGRRARRGNGCKETGKNLTIFFKSLGCTGLAQGCQGCPGHKDGCGRLMLCQAGGMLPSLLQAPTPSMGAPLCYLQQKFKKKVKN